MKRRSASRKSFVGVLMCPNRRVMIVKKDREVESKSSLGIATTSSELKTLNDDSHCEGDLLVVRQLMNSHMEEEAETHRENIFHSRWGSCVNVASERLVKKLGLPTTVHPRPYRLQWLSQKGEFLVDKQAEVTFTLGSYEDKVICDMVPMEATHLLLGKPLAI
ncbi:hypothetical protein CR513_10881, partial [Mucuna pruriens]